MNPPGIYDTDPGGFYFIPTYDPKSANFYIRAAIEDPGRSSAMRGSRVTSMQLSIANHLPTRSAGSTVTACSSRAGALYTERC